MHSNTPAEPLATARGRGHGSTVQDTGDEVTAVGAGPADAFTPAPPPPPPTARPGRARSTGAPRRAVRTSRRAGRTAPRRNTGATPVPTPREGST
ncbi:hypothetical protein GCM10009634_49840 [Saccharothrix xinjiangensis]